MSLDLPRYIVDQTDYIDELNAQNTALEAEADATPDQPALVLI